MAEKCMDMESSLYGREGGDLVEGVATFKYMGRPLDQTDDGCPEVIRNINQAHKVWKKLEELLRR